MNERFALLKSYQSGQITKERYAGQVERIERQADALDGQRKSIEAVKKAVAKYGGGAEMRRRRCRVWGADRRAEVRQR